MNYPRLFSLILFVTCVSTACTRDDSSMVLIESGESGQTQSEGSSAALDTINNAVRALSKPGAKVDYVAAEMKGVIKVRKKTQALMHYDGYRATLVTPGYQVSRIMFDFVEAKPTVRQLNEMFGTPESVRRGMLYEHTSNTSSVKLAILAEAAAMPANENSLVRRIVIEPVRTR